MAIQAGLFDLDETLVVEAVSVEAAFLATCEQARLRYGIGTLLAEIDGRAIL